MALSTPGRTCLHRDPWSNFLQASLRRTLRGHLSSASITSCLSGEAWAHPFDFPYKLRLQEGSFPLKCSLDN